MVAELYLQNLEKLVLDGRPSENVPSVGRLRSVVFFDLVGSTARKLELGHAAGVAAAMQHNSVCREVVAAKGGEVLKELGDGCLAVFDDPMAALLAAENVRTGLMLHSDLTTKVGMTVGLVQDVAIGGQPDVLGATVDRAARIQAAAAPGQVLLDRAHVDAVGDYFADVEALALDGPSRIHLRGVGEIELWALRSAAVAGVTPAPPASVRIHGAGRLPVADKLRLMETAEDEIIEFGIGLSTFTSYFTGLNPGLWREPVRDLLARGVSLRCYALDPDSPAASTYLESRNEATYKDRIRQSLEALGGIRQEFRDEDLAGSLELFTYGTLPAFYALGIDVGSNRSGAAMHFSPYLPGLRRAECPVIELSRVADPDMFDRVARSIRAQIDSAVPVE